VVENCQDGMYGSRIGRGPRGSFFRPGATQPVHETTLPERTNKESAVKPLFNNVVECDGLFQTGMVTGSLANMERTRMNAPIPKDGDRSRDKQAVYAAMSLFLRRHTASPGSSKMGW
jgi:hypothetical protein